MNLDPHRLVARTLSRPPNESEIRFGHGCRIHYGGDDTITPSGKVGKTGYVTLPASRRFVTIDGVRWSVNR